jgi:hypothetical protein
MRQRVAGILAAAGVAAVFLTAGCQKSGAEAAAQPGPPPVQPTQAKVTAYINVTSGCQQTTVDLLKQLAAQTAGKVTLEIVDFGSPEGNDQWQTAGLHCMTIFFNNAEGVSFPDGGVTRTVMFRMPAGFLWEHSDLIAAFNALADGSLHAATEQEIADLMAPVKVDLKVRAQDVSEIGGDHYGQILVNGQAIARLYGPAAVQRTKAAGNALVKWTSKAISPDDLTSATGPGGWGIYAGEALILQAKPEDLKAYGASQDQARLLANAWLQELRKVVMTAVQQAKAAQRQKASAAAGQAGGATGAPPAQPAAPAGQGQ